jgi:glycosyltransferase involved in cell wall biosynthesis
MINKTLVINTYILDDMSGSEPAAAYHFIKEVSKYFKTILVFTSHFTPEAIMHKLTDSSENITFVQTQFPLFFPKNRFGTFYLKYRIYLLRQSNQIQLMKLDPLTNIGIHYSLSNHLLGTSLYKSGIPYLFGPASTSKFSIRYIMIAQQTIILEFIRFLCIRLVLRFDPVVRKSLKNARVILAGDTRTQKLLKLSITSVNYTSTVIPHTTVDESQVREFTKKSGNKKNLMWCGAFTSRKDPKMALEVMRTLRESYGRDDFTLEMYGSGKKLKELVRFKEKHKLQNVEIHSWIKKDLLIARMTQTKILLFTSYRESGGAQLLEALACEMNVVSTDATGAIDWLSGSSIKFLGPPIISSRKHFAQILAEEVLRQYESEHTSTEISQFTVEKQVSQISEILRLFN